MRERLRLDKHRIATSLVKARYEKGKKIIDLGCGGCDWNKDRLGVFGVDTNEDLMKAAKRHGRLCDYKIADASNTGLADGSFDIVTVFKHFGRERHYEKIIEESKRLLKKGGYCIIAIPRSPEKIKKIVLKKGFKLDLVFNIGMFNNFLRAYKHPRPLAVDGGYNDLSVILPTLNEEKSISGVCRYLIEHYKGCSIIVSDDGSRDGTKRHVMDLKYKKLVFLDRAESRIHGLTASVLDAVGLVKTKYFVVIDADGQHPSEKIEEMVNILRLGSRLVVASRIEIEEEWSLDRRLISFAGSLLGKIVLLLKGKNYISYDILGGFFGCQTRFWNKSYSNRLKRQRFRLKGYKILFDFLKYLPSRTEIEEVYYKFETRKADISKINLKVYFEYLKSCLLP